LVVNLEIFAQSHNLAAETFDADVAFAVVCICRNRIAVLIYNVGNRSFNFGRNSVKVALSNKSRGVCYRSDIRGSVDVDVVNRVSRQISHVQKLDLVRLVFLDVETLICVLVALRVSVLQGSHQICVKHI
jgi:hypothetical protein